MINVLIILLLSCIAPLQADVLSVEVPAPDFSIEENAVVTQNGHYTTAAGLPKLPCRRITIALPPDAVLESVEFHGNREEFSRMDVNPCEPFLPRSNSSARNNVIGIYEERKETFYSSTDTWPDVSGEVLSTGRLRKYQVVKVTCYHFAYEASRGTLYYTPSIRVDIRYKAESAEENISASEIALRNDTTFDDIAEQKIYNWGQAREWYIPDQPREAKGYLIILPSSLIGSIQSLANHRQSQGYNVMMATVEYIDSNISGVDLPERIRNYLRSRLAATQYVLLVGTIVDLPFRDLVPFNNDPNSPYNDWDISPIPSDFYYSELSSPDNESWNSDGDSFYGEVYDQQIMYDPDDNPDQFADVHLARIPYHTGSYIEEICQKIIAFDTNRDMSYKTSSLLIASMIYFEHENYTEYEREDGAEMTEQIMNEGILSRNSADYLYEEEGLDPTTYSFTAPFTLENTIACWSRKGIVLENNHGARSSDWYARKVWSWDDGDGVAESSEITWPMGLSNSDVYELDNDYPATTFLRSCMLSNPDVDCLAKLLLYRGASSVFGSSRILWGSTLQDEGIGYHFLKRLMKTRRLSRGIVGKAFDLARIDFMEVNDFWVNLYLIHHYGDPALRQFGLVYGHHIYDPVADEVEHRKP
jgi:hypothetical protein